MARITLLLWVWGKACMKTVLHLKLTEVVASYMVSHIHCAQIFQYYICAITDYVRMFSLCMCQ